MHGHRNLKLAILIAFSTATVVARTCLNVTVYEHCLPCFELYWHTAPSLQADSSWNVMAHAYAREGKWRGNWRMEWVASTLHTTSERGVYNITTADANTSAPSSLLNWRPRRFKWTRPFRRKTKSGFCTCAITFQLTSTPKKANKRVYRGGVVDLVIGTCIPCDRCCSNLIGWCYMWPCLKCIHLS
jgi:hypothetical protein